MTTDLLLILKQNPVDLSLLAVAVKLDQDILKKRTRQLLAIERQYWLARGAQWLLVTPSFYDALVADALLNSRQWSLAAPVEKSLIDFVVINKSKWAGHSIPYVLNKLKAEFVNDDMDLAQRAFWQSAWSGRLPLDFRRGWRPHEPISLVSESTFWERNPIASRRSAWMV